MNLNTYLTIKKAAVDLVPAESGFFDNTYFPSADPADFVVNVRDYKPYEEAAEKNKKALENAYGFSGGMIGGALGGGLGWYGTDAILRNSKLSDRAKTTAKAVGALGLGALGVYAGDSFGRQLAPGVSVMGTPTIPLRFNQKKKIPFIQVIDTKFVD